MQYQLDESRFVPSSATCPLFIVLSPYPSSSLFLYISARRVLLYLYCCVYIPHDRFIFPFICRIVPPTLFALLRIHAFLSALIICVIVYPLRQLPFSMYPDKVINTSNIFRSTCPTSFQTLIYRPEYL